MHNKVKLEQCFAVTSSEKVAVFQASLKLVREEAGANSLITIVSHPRIKTFMRRRVL